MLSQGSGCGYHWGHPSTLLPCHAHGWARYYIYYLLLSQWTYMADIINPRKMSFQGITGWAQGQTGTKGQVQDETQASAPSPICSCPSSVGSRVTRGDTPSLWLRPWFSRRLWAQKAEGRLGSGEVVPLHDPRLQHGSSITAPGVTRAARLRHLSGQLLLGAFWVITERVQVFQGWGNRWTQAASQPVSTLGKGVLAP